MRPCSPLFPPNSTALLSSIAVKVKAEHGGGLSPVVAGQLHTPAVQGHFIILFEIFIMHVIGRAGASPPSRATGGFFYTV